MPRIRSFIGIDIGDEIRKKAVALQEHLARTCAGVKWVAPESLHLTLLFLGEVEDRDLAAVCKTVDKVARKQQAFPLHVSGAGAFPTLRRPKVIWGGVSEGADPVRKLHGLIEAKLLELGVYIKEEKGYAPHITLGRVKSEADGQELAPELAKLLAWDGGRTTVNQIIVYSSEPRRAGPEYVVMARTHLVGG